MLQEGQLNFTGMEFWEVGRMSTAATECVPRNYGTPGDGDAIELVSISFASEI